MKKSLLLCHLMILLSSIPFVAACSGDDENDEEVKKEEIPSPDNPDNKTPDFIETKGTVGTAVDLGLSVKWADHNVGATKPEDYGGYYAYGETEQKSIYTMETYKWSKLDGEIWRYTKYIYNQKEGLHQDFILDPEDDVAHMKWGGVWRMPTDAEIKEFLKKCKFDWIISNGVWGVKATGPNGKFIFLPAAGRAQVYVGNEGKWGTYASSFLKTDLLGGMSWEMIDFVVTDTKLVIDDYTHRNREYGCSVRPVQ